jgi:hypothetical protein
VFRSSRWVGWLLLVGLIADSLLRAAPPAVLAASLGP